ncbi:MAG: hypothetical protein ABJG41_02775 [Cyclobacteriaceae bacterium]
MSLTDKEIEEMIDALDQGASHKVDEGVHRDYEQMVRAVNFIGEERFREKLNVIHGTMRSGAGRNTNLFWISGIAAAVVGAFFWWQSMRPDLVTPELQMNEIPAYSDSATYDSLKNIEPAVDKE